jgi:hypothetical protein
MTHRINTTIYRLGKNINWSIGFSSLFMDKGMRLQCVVSLTIKIFLFSIGFRLIKLFINYENYTVKFNLFAFRLTALKVLLSERFKNVNFIMAHKTLIHFPNDFEWNSLFEADKKFNPLYLRMVSDKILKESLEAPFFFSAQEGEDASLVAIDDGAANGVGVKNEEKPQALEDESESEESDNEVNAEQKKILFYTSSALRCLDKVNLKPLSSRFLKFYYFNIVKNMFAAILKKFEQTDRLDLKYCFKVFKKVDSALIMYIRLLVKKKAIFNKVKKFLINSGLGRLPSFAGVMRS